jgi:hypothetical protein
VRLSSASADSLKQNILSSPGNLAFLGLFLYFHCRAPFTWKKNEQKERPVRCESVVKTGFTPDNEKHFDGEIVLNVERSPRFLLPFVIS